MSRPYPLVVRGRGRALTVFCGPGCRKKQAAGKSGKTQKDENTKELFEQYGWAKNEVTMEKVISVSARACWPSAVRG